MAAQACSGSRLALAQPIRYLQPRPFVAASSVRRARTVTCASAHEQAAAPVDRRSALALVAGAICSAAVATTPAAAAEGFEDLTMSESGLAWKDTVEGTGKVPTAGATIRCNYTGRLDSNGAVFDSSYGRRPLSFEVGVGRVIKGWDLGILGDPKQGIPPMKEGGKRKLRIPAELGYGARGAGGVIPPNSVLDFDVELLAPRRR